MGGKRSATHAQGVSARKAADQWPPNWLMNRAVFAAEKKDCDKYDEVETIIPWLGLGAL